MTFVMQAVLLATYSGGMAGAAVGFVAGGVAVPMTAIALGCQAVTGVPKIVQGLGGGLKGLLRVLGKVRGRES